MFKKIISWLVMVTYMTNLMSMAYVGVLIGMLMSTPAPAFASTGPEKPIMLDYKCGPGFRLIGGKCMKTEVTPLRDRCANPGYIRTGSYCKKPESRKATVNCPANYLWDQPLFPEQCSIHLGNDYTKYVRHGSDDNGERVHVPCEQGLSGDVIKKGTSCYYAQNPISINCPTDDPNATPTTVSMSCNDMAKAMGQCDAQAGTYTTPDMRWKLNRATYMCSRTLYGGVEKYCPTGYEQQDGECKKVTLVDVTSSCKPGYYRKGKQCFPGSTPSCGAGTTMRYGVCVASDGSLSCPSGQYLEAGSNMCVKNRSDSQPATYDSTDFNYFYNQGATLGGFAADSVSMPSVGAANTGVSAKPEFMNAKSKLTDGDLFKSVATGGVDANNGFSKPDGTYQNEDKQSKFIRSTLDDNEDFLKGQDVTPGATSEEIVDNTNHSAVAYGALMDSRNLNPKRKVSRDSAMFQTSREAVSDAFTGKGAYFGDCSDENTTYRELDEDKIVTTEHTCLKPNKNNLSGCIVDRILHKPTLNIIEGADNAKVQVCGDKCVRLTLGKTGDNYLPQFGACGIYKEKIAIGLLKGNKVNKATLISGSYDDHFRLKADGVTFYDGVHGTFPTADGFPTSSTSCERSKSRSVGRADVTSAFQNAFAGDDRIDFDYQVGVGGDGEAFAVVELLFDKDVSTHWTEEFRQSPEGCNERLKNPKTFCTADQFQCDKEVLWQPIDLGNWATEDSNGVWDVANANSNDVLQKANGDPTSFLSEVIYERNTFKGYITVKPGWDDDFIGFVFSYPKKGTDMSQPGSDFYLISWKAGSQKGAMGGLVLAKVKQGGMNAIPWVHQRSTPNYQVLKTYAKGWGYGKKYEFLLEVRPDRFKLSIDGIDIFTQSGTFPKGRIGFYNNSQDSVLYSKVKQLYPAGMGRDAEHLFHPLYDGAPEFPVCMTAHRPNYVCDPLKGKKLSLNGGHFGFKDIIKMNDACSSLDKDTECDAISQECLPGWKDDATNTCYAWNVNYECQDTSNAVVTKVRKNNTCMTDIDCIDGNCDVRADEESTDFVNALTTYATMNELGTTKKCSDPSDPATCEVFGGEPRWCAWDQLKINDCCEQPPGVNTLNVFTLGQNLYTVTGYTASAEGAFAGSSIQTGLESAGQAVEGAWNNLKDPIVDAASSAWDAMSSKLTGAVGNTAGNTSANLVSSSGSVIGNFSTAVTQAMTNFKNTLMQEIYNLLPEALQGAIQGAAQALGGSAGATGAAAMNTIGANVMAVVSFIGWAYAVYQLAKLAYTMLTACEKVEEDMGVMLLGKKCFKTSHKSCKKVFGVCTNRYKNFYCCYESVISRIIMQQAIVQLGWSPKTFRDSMGCRGLKISELTRVDFGKIDFSEWVSMMAQSNQLPEGKDMDAITEGNISNGFGRSNTLDRNQDRAPDNAWVKRRTEMEQGDIGNNVNCNQRPRPKSCDQDAYTPNN